MLCAINMRKHLVVVAFLLLVLCCRFDDGNCAVRRKARSCLQPILSGNCFGYVPSYAYNPYDRRCEQFVYGGCGGNDNRFDTRGECELNCRDV